MRIVDGAYDIFRFESNDIKPEKGRVLISEPFLEGRYFNRSVILLTEFNEKGAVGFILNKSINTGVNEVLTDLAVFESEVFIGGPVQNSRIYYMHTVPNLIPNSFQIIDGLYWGGDFEVLKDLIKSKRLSPDQVRFFLGYSGWGAGQLGDEIKENSWLVSSLNVDELMSTDTSNLWRKALGYLGGNYKVWANFPNDESHN